VKYPTKNRFKTVSTRQAYSTWKSLSALISLAPVVVSVNTGTVHIAAAVGTPVVVLYALTNPQHTPWKVPCKILPFHIPAWAQSKNEVIRHVHRFLSGEDVPLPDEQTISCAVKNCSSQRDSLQFLCC
jgi:ADP-heptose:LPS heptosyltransferase